MAGGTSARKDDTFLEVFRKHDAVMLLVEPGTGRILDANLAAEKFYGYSLAQFKGMNIAGINALSPGQASAEWERGRSVFFHKLSNGRVRTVEARISPVISSGESALFCIIHDITESAPAQNTLHTNELRLRALAGHIPTVLYQCLNDKKYTFTYVNDAVLQLTGYPAKAFLEEELSFYDLYHPDDISIVNAPFDKYFHITYRIRHRSGEWRWVDEWGAGVLDEYGEIEYIEGIMLDVTAQKLVENALRESKDRYLSLFDNMMDGIYRSTHDGRFVDINPAMVKMFGYSSKEEMLQIDIRKELYFLPEERGSHILDTGMEEIEVYRMRRKDGSEIWVEDHGYYVHDEQGNIIYHEGMLRDVTERIKAEEALRESRDFLKESQTIAGLGSYVLDLSTGRWKSSDVLDRIFGVDETHDHTLEGWADLIHPDDKEEMLNYFANEVIGNKTRFDKEYRIIRKNDRAERWVHGMGELEIDKQGQAGKMRGSIQDITERKQTEDSLRQRLLELEALHNVSASLQTVQTFEEALPILLDQTLTALGTDTGAILLYDADRDELRGTPPRGWFREFQDTPVKVGEGVAGTVFASGKPYITLEFARDPLPQSAARGKIPAGWGGACLPIRAGAEIVGVLFVSVQLPRQITSEQLKLLTSLAEIAGATLHRTRLYDETARSAREFASLYETSKSLSAESDLNATLQVIVDNAKKLLNSASSGMFLFDPVAGDLELKVDTEAFMPLGMRLSLGEGVAGRVAQTRKPMRIDDHSAGEGHSPRFADVSLRAVLDVPMLYGGELIGVLTVDEIGDSERKFTEADERLLSLFASQAAGVIHSARLHEEAIDRLQHLQTLRTIDKAIASSLDLGITLNILLNHVVTQLDVDAADVLLLQTHEQTLQYSAGRGFHTRMIEGADVHLNDGFAGRCVMERRIIQVFDPRQVVQNQPFYRLWSEEGFTVYICVPLIARGEVKGVLEVYRRSKFTPTEEWLEFLETLAGQAAITIDNAQLFDNIQRVNMELVIAYEATIDGWARAFDLRDKETEGHTRLVTELTLALAKAVGINDSELQHIRRGALLHDIGKMGISDRILLKKGKLTKKEWEVMRTHPALAFKMLQPINYLRQSLDIPYCHHEKWDGTGYPRGLKGEMIPLSARIFAIADVWEALISSRPYRKAWTKKKALAYIREQSGKHFDPKIVEIFMRVIKNFQGLDAS
jgi:PAS domain S-box-containing protein/putative nucleotidyltransferase with HDIG domain